MLKILCSPFDKLRANGLGLESIAHFPFVLSPSTSSGQALSKHENPYFQHPARENTTASIAYPAAYKIESSTVGDQFLIGKFWLMSVN